MGVGSWEIGTLLRGPKSVSLTNLFQIPTHFSMILEEQIQDVCFVSSHFPIDTSVAHCHMIVWRIIDFFFKHRG